MLSRVFPSIAFVSRVYSRPVVSHPNLNSQIRLITTAKSTATQKKAAGATAKKSVPGTKATRTKAKSSDSEKKAKAKARDAAKAKELKEKVKAKEAKEKAKAKAKEAKVKLAEKRKEESLKKKLYSFKRPPSLYALFIKENHLKYKAEQLPSKEIFKRLASDWKTTSDEEKARFSQIIREKSEEYHKQVARIPKKPISGYLLFANEIRSTLGTSSFGDSSHLISQKWKELSEAEKDKYRKLSDKEREHYQKAVTDFENERKKELSL